MIRNLLVAALVLGAVARILITAGEHYPLANWRLWQVLGYWAMASYAAVGCFGLGGSLLSWLGDEAYDEAERAVVGFALGVLAFAMLIVIAGCFEQLSFAFAACAPLLGVVAYGPRRWLRVAAQFRAQLEKWRHNSISPLLLAAIALGALVLTAVYIPILTVQNIQHDARWYHLPIAAQYAAQGTLEPFAEGWVVGAYPHLSSYLYTWALLLPVDVVHRLGVAAHFEFLLFVATIASVPVLARRLSPQGGTNLSWAVFFLFPGYLTYDSNVSLGADHVAALWAAPLLIVTMELWHSLRVKDALLLGALCAAAAGTKYSAVCLVLPIAVAMLFVLSNAAWKFRHQGVVRTAGKVLGLGVAMAGAFALLWAPHWLKNWLWYGDPLYPILNKILHVHPWNPTTAARYEGFNTHDVIHAPRTLAGAYDALKYALSYGFETQDYGFHGKEPVFGYLFAALLPATPFLRLGKRPWATIALSIVGLVTWQLVYSRDRYVQALLPWLVVVTAIALRQAWRTHSPVLRASVVVLVTLQAFLAANVFFLRDYVMASGKHPLNDIMDRVTQSFVHPMDVAVDQGKPSEMRLWQSVGQLLPRQAKVLVHRQRLWVGIDAPVVTDESMWQAGIDYDRLGSGRALLTKLLRWNVTHAVVGDYPHNYEFGPDTAGGELVLWDLLYEAKELPLNGPWRLWQLAKVLPKKNHPALVAWNTCKTKLRPAGVYRLSDLGLIEGHAPAKAVGPLVPQPAPDASLPRFAVTEQGCPRPHKSYTRIATREKLQLWWDKSETARRP